MSHPSPSLEAERLGIDDSDTQGQPDRADGRDGDACPGPYAAAVPLPAMPVVAAIAALLGALSLFGALVSLGAWLVRTLGLPADPPDTCRFEPRPPAVGSPEGALRRAETWEQRRAACDAAAACHRDAVRIHEILGEVMADDAGHSALLADLKPAAERAEAAVDEAAAAMHGDDLEQATTTCTALAAEVAALRTTAEERIAALPTGPRSHRSLIILGILLAVVLLWLLIALPLLQRSLSQP